MPCLSRWFLFYKKRGSRFSTRAPRNKRVSVLEANYRRKDEPVRKGGWSPTRKGSPAKLPLRSFLCLSNSSITPTKSMRTLKAKHSPLTDSKSATVFTDKVCFSRAKTAVPKQPIIAKVSRNKHNKSDTLHSPCWGTNIPAELASILSIFYHFDL